MRRPRRTTPPAAPGCACHLCRPERRYDDPQDRACLDVVAEHGWRVMLISDDAGCCATDHAEHEDPHGAGVPEPAFAYTVGLGHTLDHPELVVSGLDLQLMHRVLDGVAQRVVAGRRLAPGDVLEDVLGGVPVVVERASAVALEEVVTWSGWFHRRPPEALVLVWPTTDGLFAWQPGAPAVLDERQPPRWREPSSRGGGVAPDPAWVLPAPPDAPAFTCRHVLDEGAPVLWVAREPDPDRGEDWTAHCGDTHTVDEAAAVHLAHLVRTAPSLRELGDLALGCCAERADVDAPWEVAPLSP